MGGYYQGLTKGEGNVYFYAIPKEKIDASKIDMIVMDEIKNDIDSELSNKRFEIEKKSIF